MVVLQAIILNYTLENAKIQYIAHLYKYNLEHNDKT